MHRNFYSGADGILDSNSPQVELLYPASQAVLSKTHQHLYTSRLRCTSVGKRTQDQEKWIEGSCRLQRVGSIHTSSTAIRWILCILILMLTHSLMARRQASKLISNLAFQALVVISSLWWWQILSEGVNLMDCPASQGLVWRTTYDMVCKPGAT